MIVEHRTTVSASYRALDGSVNPDDPVSPEGDGWVLVTSTAVEGAILHTWRRSTTVEYAVEPREASEEPATTELTAAQRVIEGLPGGARAARRR